MQVPYHAGNSFAISKQYYGLMQYCKFIKNGWTILDSNHPDTTLAAISPEDGDSRTIVLVVSNFDGAGVILPSSSLH